MRIGRVLLTAAITLVACIVVGALADLVPAVPGLQGLPRILVFLVPAVLLAAVGWPLLARTSALAPRLIAEFSLAGFLVGAVIGGFSGLVTMSFQCFMQSACTPSPWAWAPPFATGCIAGVGGGALIGFLVQNLRNTPPQQVLHP